MILPTTGAAGVLSSAAQSGARVNKKEPAPAALKAWLVKVGREVLPVQGRTLPGKKETTLEDEGR